MEPAPRGFPRLIQGSNDMSILVVEDNPLIRQVVAETLLDEGYVVLTATTGAEAFAMLAQAGPLVRLIILDLMLPDMSGREVRSRLLDDPALAQIPILVLSAMSQLDRQTAELGVARVLGKPFVVNEFLEAVAALYGPRRDVGS